MANEKILVVDDEKDIGRLLELTLTRTGYQVRRAFDGEEALTQVEQERPDLILLDVMMPKLDGLQTCQRLKADPTTANIPIIMLTAKAQAADKVAGLSIGADDYVPKPFNHQEVLARVKGLLQRTEKIRYLNPLMGVLGEWFTDEGVEQLGKELEVARRIQMGLLPKSVPEVPGIEVGAVLHSSKSVGGDFYDFIPAESGTLALALGDVSGKGIPAALVMVMVRAFLRVIGSEGATPDTVLAKVNRHLSRDIPPGMFVTMFYASLDPVARTLIYSNAGHWGPLLFREGQPPARLESEGMVLGVDESATFALGEVKLERGDLLAFFTDGVVEAPGPTGQLLGEVGLQTLLEAHRELGAQELADLIAASVKEWAHGALSDDLTLVVLKT